VRIDIDHSDSLNSGLAPDRLGEGLERVGGLALVIDKCEDFSLRSVEAHSPAGKQRLIYLEVHPQ
jgi:hypothetical protein